VIANSDDIASTLHSLRLAENETGNVGFPPNQGHSVERRTFMSEEMQQDPSAKGLRPAAGLSTITSKSGGMNLRKANPTPYTKALIDITEEFRAAARGDISRRIFRTWKRWTLLIQDRFARWGFGHPRGLLVI
jgi:hypothetical protein